MLEPVQRRSSAFAVIRVCAHVSGPCAQIAKHKLGWWSGGWEASGQAGEPRVGLVGWPSCGCLRMVDWLFNELVACGAVVVG